MESHLLNGLCSTPLPYTRSIPQARNCLKKPLRLYSQCNASETRCRKLNENKCAEENRKGLRNETYLNSSPIILPLALVAAAAAEEPGYSAASYYTTLGLFLLSVPGVWSLVKRSTKSKIVKKTFLVDGPGKSEAKPLSKLAGEITSFLTTRKFVPTERGEVAKFEGTFTPSRGQGAFLVFCTFLSLLSMGLVLSIAVPSVGDNWYYLTVLSPLSGVYYWTKATRNEVVEVKMVIADDELTADVIIQGDDEVVETLRKELALMEKGMVYVKGILE